MIDFFFNKLRRITRRIAAIAGAIPESADPAFARSAQELSHRDLPVFLLSGTSPRRMCDVLERRLKKDGFFVCQLGVGGIFDLVSGQDMEAMAENLSTQVARICANYSLGKFAIVALGAPGLVASYYVKRLGGDENCASLVTVSTPHGGIQAIPRNLPKHLFFAFRQVSLDSPFIRRLSAGAFPKAIHVASIYSRRSRRYPFPASCLKPESGPNAVNVEVLPARLDSQLASRSVYEEIRRQILVGLAPSQDGNMGGTS